MKRPITFRPLERKQNYSLLSLRRQDILLHLTPRVGLANKTLLSLAWQRRETKTFLPKYIIVRCCVSDSLFAGEEAIATSSRAPVFSM